MSFDWGSYPPLQQQVLFSEKASGGCRAKVEGAEPENGQRCDPFRGVSHRFLLFGTIGLPCMRYGKHAARQTKSNPDSCHHCEREGAVPGRRGPDHETIESPGAGRYYGRYSIPVKEEARNARSLRDADRRLRDASRFCRRLRQAGTPRARGSGGSRGGGPRGGRKDPLRGEVRRLPRHRPGDRPQESKEKWASIVKEMQGKKSDWISDADASKIVDYLAADHGKK